MQKNIIINKPPMGWNSYDYYDTSVNETQVKANADYMAKHLKEFGWEYIIVDIQWYAYDVGTQREKHQYLPFGRVEMDEYGRLQPCPDRFPSSAGGAGFAPLAEYVHNLGLKFGIHIMRGIPRAAAHGRYKILGTDRTADQIANPYSICGWNPDMYGLWDKEEGAQEYYQSIIRMYADWGVDYIKCDDICNTNLYKDNLYSARHEIEMLQKAIQDSGRDIVLSLSPGPALIEEAWHYEKYANMWRITDDFWDEWKHLKNMFRRCEIWQEHVGGGCYPDCDMLPLGMLGKGFADVRMTRFTQAEQITMMTLWCLFRSPLMLGAELTLLDEWTLSLLTNAQVLGLLAEDNRARQIRRDDQAAIWFSRNEKTGDCHLGLFNFAEQETEVTCRLEDLDESVWGKENLTELWTGESFTVKDGMISLQIAPHGAKLLKISE